MLNLVVPSREKVSKVALLQAQLEQAHERGTALCGEASRAVGAVRVWIRRMRDKHRSIRGGRVSDNHMLTK